MTREVAIRKLLRPHAMRDATGEGVVGDGRGDIGVVEEFWIPRTNVRADLAIVGAELHGYEIKSDADTLRRLPSQAAAFNRIFDRCSAVIAERHLDRVVELVPSWWGILVVSGSDAATGHLRTVRRGATNPAVDVDFVVRLLWRDEVEQALREYGAEPDLEGGRSAMWSQLLACADDRSIARAVRAALRRRVGWRGATGRPRLMAAPTGTSGY